MSFNRHSQIAWGIDAYADPGIQWSGHHPLTSPTLSPSVNYRNNNNIMARHNVYSGQYQGAAATRQQRYRSRQAQQRTIRPPVRKMQIHLSNMQASLLEMERRYASVKETLRPSQQRVWLDKIKLVRTERDMLFLEMQAQATLGLGPVPPNSFHTAPDMTRNRSTNHPNYKLTAQVEQRRKEAEDPPVRYEASPTRMGGPLPYSALHPSNVMAGRSNFDFEAVKEDLKIPERPSTAPEMGNRTVDEVGDGNSFAYEQATQPTRWNDTEHTYKSGIFTYNGKSVVIEDAGLHRKTQRRVRRDRQPIRSVISRDENAVQSVKVPFAGPRSSSKDVKAAAVNPRAAPQNFKRDVVDVMELMEIKSVKSYRKLYDPKIVRKLERIKAVGGYGKSTKRSPPVSPAKSTVTSKKSVKTEINLARQSLVDFKKERNVLEKEIESDSIPEEEGITARPKTAPAKMASASNGSEDNNTAIAGNSIQGDSERTLKEALERIEKLELEVVQWKRAAKDAASVSISQSIAKLTKPSKKTTIDDIVEEDFHEQAVAQRKRKKVILNKVETGQGFSSGLVEAVSTPSSSNPRKKPRTSEKEPERSFDTSGTKAPLNPLLRSFDIVEISQLMQKDGIKFTAGTTSGQDSQALKENAFSEFDIVDSVLEDVVGKVVVQDGGIDTFDIVERVVENIPGNR